MRSTPPIRFQAQDQIPMPLDQAVLDHEVVARGGGPQEGRRWTSVTVAARRDMVGSCSKRLRQAPACAPVGIDLSAFGIIRAPCAGGGPPEGLRVGRDDALLLPRRRHQPRRCARSGCLFTRVAPSASRHRRGPRRAQGPVGRGRSGLPARGRARGADREFDDLEPSSLRPSAGASKGALEAARRTPRLARVLRRPGRRRADRARGRLRTGSTIAGPPRADPGAGWVADRADSRRPRTSTARTPRG